jgi:succinoglycan biosynthesis protein ExoA
VSFIVPVHNGANCLRATLAAIVAQADGRGLEIIVVEDRSSDGSSELIRRLAEHWTLRIVQGEGRGAAAAINAGLRAARFPIVCQVDQDVVLHHGWMRRLTDALADPSLAAAQGYYVRDSTATLCARAMNLDLEQRYAAISGEDTDHVCTGNTAYRVEALRRVGLFDETLGYGYDNDISYRLQLEGYRLAFCREARSTHRWREGLVGYVIQQYGFGYGRLDLVAKHPRRVTGDFVSPAAMMAHPILMSMAVAAFAAAGLLAAIGAPGRLLALTATALLVGLALERLAVGIAAARRFHDPTPLIFPLLHLVRDLVWVSAIGVWLSRRLIGRAQRPAHSMRPRAIQASRAKS